MTYRTISYTDMLGRPQTMFRYQTLNAALRDAEYLRKHGIKVNCILRVTWK